MDIVPEGNITYNQDNADQPGRLHTLDALDIHHADTNIIIQLFFVMMPSQ